MNRKRKTQDIHLKGEIQSLYIKQQRHREKKIAGPVSLQAAARYNCPNDAYVPYVGYRLRTHLDAVVLQNLMMEIGSNDHSYRTYPCNSAAVVQECKDKQTGLSRNAM